MTTHIDIIGTGRFGLTLAYILSHNDDVAIRMVARSPAIVDEINSSHTVSARIPITFSGNIEGVLLNEATAADASHIIVAVPAQYTRDQLRSAYFSGLSDKTHLLHVVKGIEPAYNGHVSGNTMSQVIEVELGRTPAVLSGANLAHEILQGQEAGAVLAGRSLNGWQDLFTIQNKFYVSTSPDIIGVELAGTYKNVIALALGMVYGWNEQKEYGSANNLMGDTLSKGFRELEELGRQYQANRETFTGPAGIGDIVATGYSTGSRNFEVGRQRVRGIPLAEILTNLQEGNRGVPEGPHTVKVLNEIHGEDLPFNSMVGQILADGPVSHEQIQKLYHPL